MKNYAIIVVDELYDFIDGSMACIGASDCVRNSAAYLSETAGRLPEDQESGGMVSASGVPVLFVCDHHPAGHCSFKEQGGPWPAHCVQGTRGGAIAEPLLPYVEESLCFYKGTDPGKEQYSGFEGVNEAGQSLNEVLQLLDIKNVVVIGIATEYCVRNTAEDLLRAGYSVTVKEDCLAWVDTEGHHEAIAAMKAEGIRFLS